mgnify:CR=1 FL=1
MYLAPLINNLQELWKHLDVIDATKLRGLQALKLSGYLAWTNHDYLAYGFCSCLKIKGFKAIPPCSDWLRSTYCKSLKKNTYLKQKHFSHEDQPLHGKA